MKPAPYYNVNKYFAHQKEKQEQRGCWKTAKW